mmetsp:Transcript_13333/g.19611  ORF Transcript_13333/g.19611 Transcript_13333/m.19611 type:complete len:339 (+) Transcript_13333:219-1235(+)
MMQHILDIVGSSHRSLPRKAVHGQFSLRRLYYFIMMLSLLSTSSIADEPECEVFQGGGRVLIKDKMVMVEESNFPKHFSYYPLKKKERDDDQSYYILQEEKPVLYLPHFLNQSMAQELKDICNSQNRFVPSRIRGRGHTADDDDATEQHETIRTSDSCAMVPAAQYRSNPRFIEMLQKDNDDPLPPQVAAVAREVEVSWDIAVRAAKVLGVNPELVEALQLVRYTSPEAEYQLHHDHGKFYEKTTEHRPWTMLIFLNDVVDAGGHTGFPKLELEVIPRGGDALIWSNVIQTGGEVDEDMVHMGKPPTTEEVEKYAVNVWFGEDTLDGRIARGEFGEWS